MSTQPSRIGLAVQRSIDFFVASLVLVTLSPLLLVLAVLIRKQMGSPILFRQERPGMKEKIFTVIKFRTMRDAVGADGNPLPDEDRLTNFGRWLRRTSLDELPQLWSVLKGDMSLVGPRPLLVEYLDLYRPEHRRRHWVKPGITGWAQVNGRNAVSWEEKFKLDIWYVDNWSIALNFKILWMTVSRVFSGHGVSSVDCETMPRFRG